MMPQKCGIVTSIQNLAMLDDCCRQHSLLFGKLLCFLGFHHIKHFNFCLLKLFQ